jgi:hypothetical protein
MTTMKLLLLALAAQAFVGPVWADIYKCRNGNGHVVYSDTPCAPGSRQGVVVRSAAGAGSAAAPARPARLNGGGEFSGAGQIHPETIARIAQSLDANEAARLLQTMTPEQLAAIAGRITPAQMQAAAQSVSPETMQALSRKLGGEGLGRILEATSGALPADLMSGVGKDRVKTLFQGMPEAEVERLVKGMGEAQRQKARTLARPMQ